MALIRMWSHKAGNIHHHRLLHSHLLSMSIGPLAESLRLTPVPTYSHCQ